MTPLLVALGAGVGAVLRFVVASAADRPGFPLGTWAVNVAGSLVLGLLVGLGTGPEASALLGVGFCGGLTTFSALAVQTRERAVDRGAGGGAAYAGASLAGALAACAVGYAVGSLLA